MGDIIKVCAALSMAKWVKTLLVGKKKQESTKLSCFLQHSPGRGRVMRPLGENKNLRSNASAKLRVDGRDVDEFAAFDFVYDHALDRIAALTHGDGAGDPLEVLGIGKGFPNLSAVC